KILYSHLLCLLILTPSLLPCSRSPFFGLLSEPWHSLLWYIDSTADEDHVVVVVGQPLELRCSASGNPPPVLTWLKDGLPLSHGTRTLLLGDGMLLRAEQASESSAGIYTCLASSPAGESMVQRTVVVQGTSWALLPGSPSCVHRANGSNPARGYILLYLWETVLVSVVKAGETVLECEAVGTPPPTVTWVKDGRPVVNGDGLLLTNQGRRLRIPKAEVTHSGRYTCLATNAVGQEERGFDVAVHGKDAGRDLLLGCVEAGRLEKACDAPLHIWWSMRVDKTLTGRRVSEREGEAPCNLPILETLPVGWRGKIPFIRLSSLCPASGCFSPSV
uniref:Ig-like domain-containing protein n=1 Tax=Dromaius novaehollandiae TaxID=8790 RepID=A0A8C4JSK2_DRONO